MKSGFVVIAGRPNVGKSTLLNQLLGSELSIVSPKAQTTRERIFGILTEKERGQIVFVDTPGVHRAREGGINAYMVGEARQGIEGSDVVWYLLDPSSKLEHEIVVIDALLTSLSSEEQRGVTFFVILNKVDRIPAEALRDGGGARKLINEVQAALREKGFGGTLVPVEISALKGRGVDTLLERTWSLLPEGPLYYPDPDQMSDKPLRFFAGELVRKQLFEQLGEELPYSCAVEVRKFDEKAKPLRIEARIHVERDSQKGMVIGAGGKKIKAIGEAARGEIEKLVGQKIFLGLQVEVTPQWTRDERKMKKLGYILPDKTKARPA